ncbi:MAG: protein kinase [Gemmataceae bacterium]
MPPTTAHPTDVALAAYALGKLAAADAETVRGHLDACPRCRTLAERTPADTFVRLLQKASGRSKAETPAPSVAATGVQPPQAAVATGVQDSPPPADAEIPPALRDHPALKVQRLLGRGGMGAVYLAHHAMLDKPVAVKVMAPELVADEKSVARFHAEIRAVAKLDHPNIVRALDAQTAGGLHLFVMEYVDGQRLDEVVAARGRLPVDYACKCARLAALGLQHAHEKGLAHRDFKPQNLMLSKAGQVKILDFGLAKLATETKSRGGMTSQGVILGTPEYMAPEQARDTSSAGPPADIYALGATLFFLLTGRPPFTGGSAIDIVMKQINEPPPRVTELRPDVPQGLADLIARMLAKDAADRPATAKEVAEALGPYTKRTAMANAEAADVNPLAFDGLPSLTTSLRKPATRRRWPLVAGRRHRSRAARGRPDGRSGGRASREDGRRDHRRDGQRAGCRGVRRR